MIFAEELREASKYYLTVYFAKKGYEIKCVSKYQISMLKMGQEQGGWPRPLYGIAWPF